MPCSSHRDHVCQDHLCCFRIRMNLCFLRGSTLIVSFWQDQRACRGLPILSLRSPVRSVKVSAILPEGQNHPVHLGFPVVWDLSGCHDLWNLRDRISDLISSHNLFDLFFVIHFRRWTSVAWPEHLPV